VNHNLAVLKHMLKNAVKWGLIKQNYASEVKLYPVEEGRIRFLTEEEIRRLLSACKSQINYPRLYPLVILALNTGMRQGELLKLTWGNVDLERGLITLAASART